MRNILTLKEIKPHKRMVQLMVRVPPAISEKVEEIVERHPKGIKAADVYRTAIIDFVENYSTDCRDNSSKPRCTNCGIGRGLPTTNGDKLKCSYCGLVAPKQSENWQIEEKHDGK